MRQIDAQQVFSDVEEILQPAHTALMVVDMQNDFCTPGGYFHQFGRDVSAVQSVIPGIIRLVDGARRAGVKVIFIQQTTLPSQASDPPAWTYFKTRDGKSWDYTLPGTWGEQLVEGLEHLPGEPVVKKHRPSSFHMTNLDLILRSYGTRSVLVCGCLTQGCVMATVLDASFHNYYTVVAEDCVQSTNQAMHQNALTFMASRYDIVTADGAMAIWGPKTD